MLNLHDLAVGRGLVYPGVEPDTGTCLLQAATFPCQCNQQEFVFGVKA